MKLQKVKQVRVRGGYLVKPLSEKTARMIIGLMRSMAHATPMSPFHSNAANEMERLLEEVLTYRAQCDLAGDTNALRVRRSINDV